MKFISVREGSFLGDDTIIEDFSTQEAAERNCQGILDIAKKYNDIIPTVYVAQILKEYK